MKTWPSLLASILLVSTSMAGAANVRIHVLSGRADMVSGGSALIEIEGIDQQDLATFQILAGTRDVTSAFRLAHSSQSQIGLVKELPLGKTELLVKQRGKKQASLLLTNYPIAGPIFSGPHQKPFACEPEVVKMGPVLDADCSVPTKILYYYRSTLPPTTEGPLSVPSSTTTFRPYDPSAPRPSDMSQTTTTDGHTVDFIVRREIGTINRSIYSIAFLHQPGQPLPDPWTKVPGWNGTLVYTYQGGVEPGYRQGNIPPPLNESVLAKGFAEVGSTLTTFGNNANDVLAAETTMMVKEHFIKTYGVPVHTIGNGGSGGSMQQFLIAQNYPGLLDALFTYLSFPDTFSIIPGAVDCALLAHYFENSSVKWTMEQKVAVSGFASPAVCESWSKAHFAPGWLRPQRCILVPETLIYDPAKRPTGVRCDLYDNEVNILGRDPKTSFARRPLDNVGVQYGLEAFNSGIIDAQEFLELNERIGGFDVDGNFTHSRTVASSEALRTAYETGRIEKGGGSLGAIPIIDSRTYRDVPGNLHDKFRTYELQARLQAANGDADNLVLFTQMPETVFPLVLLNHWLNNISRDTSDATPAAKVRRDKPSDLVDACWTRTGEKIVEPASYDGPGRCNQLYPAHGDPRMAAGAPLAGTALKCALMPVDRKDYKQPLTREQFLKLKSIFSEGVCDYSTPGIQERTGLASWHVYPNI